MPQDFGLNFISLKQASEISGYHQDYLSQLIRQGKIKGTKIGRNWFVVEEEIKTLSANNQNQEKTRKGLRGKIIFIFILLILIASIFIFQKAIAPKTDNNFPKPIENEQPLF